MQAYLNDSKLKTAMVASMREHGEADRLRKGSYGTGLQNTPRFQGCFIGCAVESVNEAKGKDCSADDHASLESELGIPEWMAHLVDRVFENLPKEAAQAWPVRFLEAVPVGADLEAVKTPFLLWLMERNRGLVEGLDISDELKQQVLEAIDGVVDVIQNNNATAADAAAVAAHAAYVAHADARRAARAARDAAADDAAAVAVAYAAGVAHADAHADARRAARAARDAAADDADAGAVAYAAGVAAHAFHADAADAAAAAADAADAAAYADAAADATAYADAAHADAYAAHADAYVSIADKLIDLTQWRVARDGES